MGLEHIKPYQFPPGKSGNPGGRPSRPRAEMTLEAALVRRLRREPELMDRMVDMLFKEASKGKNMLAAKILAERIGGAVGGNVYDAAESSASSSAAPRTVIQNDEDADATTDLPRES